MANPTRQEELAGFCRIMGMFINQICDDVLREELEGALQRLINVGDTDDRKPGTAELRALTISTFDAGMRFQRGP